MYSGWESNEQKQTKTYTPIVTLMHVMFLSLCLLSAALTRMERLLLLYRIVKQDKAIN